MSFERVMGLDVVNDAEYQLYRDAMSPILKIYGGAFGFDFKVSEVLLSKTEDNINRVFTLEFPSKKNMDDFFSDAEYMAVKKQYFDNSVKNITVISMHEKNEVL